MKKNLQLINIDLTQALMVGDSLQEIEVAHAANCEMVLMRTGKATALPTAIREKVPVFDFMVEQKY